MVDQVKEDVVLLIFRFVDNCVWSLSHLFFILNDKECVDKKKYN